MTCPAHLCFFISLVRDISFCSLQEFDFVLSDMALEVIGDFAVVWLLSPKKSFTPQANTAFARYINNLPGHCLQVCKRSFAYMARNSQSQDRHCCAPTCPVPQSTAVSSYATPCKSNVNIKRYNLTLLRLCIAIQPLHSISPTRLLTSLIQTPQQQITDIMTFSPLNSCQHYACASARVAQSYLTELLAYNLL